MPENLEIRQANLIDQAAILHCLVMMQQEAESMTDEPDWFKVSHIIIEQIRQGMVYVAVKDGMVVGTIGLSASSEWYSNVPIVGDLWFFVLKEHRASGAAFKLLKHVRDLAREENIKLKVGHVLGYSVDRLDKFYGKLGFTRTGTLYRLE